MAGRGTTTPVELAGELLGLLGRAVEDRAIHGVGDAAYHGKPLLVTGTTWTTRLPANSVLAPDLLHDYALACAAAAA